MTHFTAHFGFVRLLGTCIRVLLASACLVTAWPAMAQQLERGNYYYYAPEHEKYSPTIFYGEPRFDTRQVRIKTTQRFKLLDGRKGWFLLEFDIAGKVFIHQRLLRGLLYDPATADPWNEFERASVFEEEPKKIQARLQAARSNPQAGAQTNTKVPSWKRYKDSWGVKTGRTTTLPAADGAETDVTQEPSPTRTYDRKARQNKYPLLPPIGSQPAQTPAEPGTPPEVPGPAMDAR